MLERWTGGDRSVAVPAGVKGWFVPVTGSGEADGVAWAAGDCLVFEGQVSVKAGEDADLLFAYPGERYV